MATRVIREYAEEGKTCVLRTDTYQKQLSYFLMLFNEAKKDFPNLKAEDVCVVKYGGDHQRRQNGIEFEVDELPPEKYTRIYTLELTL